MFLFPSHTTPTDTSIPLSLLTDQDHTSCAWCNDEAGIDQGKGSHGICKEHAEEVYNQIHKRREERNKKGR